MGSENFSDVSYKPNYKASALRYEVGEHSNFVHVPMLIASLRQLNKWKPERIQEYCASITKSGIEMRAGQRIFYWRWKVARSAHVWRAGAGRGRPLKKSKALCSKQNLCFWFAKRDSHFTHLYNREADMEKFTRTLIKLYEKILHSVLFVTLDVAAFAQAKSYTFVFLNNKPDKKVLSKENPTALCKVIWIISGGWRKKESLAAGPFDGGGGLFCAQHNFGWWGQSVVSNGSGRKSKALEYRNVSVYPNG